MAYQTKNTTEIKTKAKAKIAEGLLELAYLREINHFEEKDCEFKDTVIDQVKICEELMCPVSLEKIIEWVNSKDIGKVRTEARTIKFAS